MKNRKESFLCSLAWAHISTEASGRVRLCCHDELATLGHGPYIEEIGEVKLRHGLDFYKKIQNDMQEGVVPKNCEGCLKIEREGGISPRAEYNERFSCRGDLEYLDITLDNNCNLKCRMCSPKYSSGIKKDWDKLGIPLSEEDEKSLSRISAGEWFASSQAQSFWDEALESIKLITFTGGEPFLSSHLASIIRRIGEHERRGKIELRFYTNTTIFPDKYVEVLENFKKVTFFCSLDGAGHTSDYIRYPSQWNKIEAVFKDLMSWSQRKENIEVRVHCVVQAYNIHSLCELFDFLKSYSKELPMIPALTPIETPKLFSLDILPIDQLERAKGHIDQYILENAHLIDEFHQQANREQLQNLYSYLDGAKKNNQSEQKYIEFVALTKRFDQLRGQSFKKIG